MRRPAGGSEKSTNVSIGSFRSASFVLCFLDEDDDENNEDGDKNEDVIGTFRYYIFLPFFLSQPPMQHKKVREKEKKMEEKKEKTRKEETEELSE